MDNDNFTGIGVFGGESRPIFDGVRHTQGGLPHLLQHLWDQYVDTLREAINTREEAGRPTVTLQEAIKRAPATAFLTFAADYLTKNRPVENFFLDMNHGFRLTNNALVSLCPGTQIQGTMQPDSSVPVTHGLSQQDVYGAGRGTGAPGMNFAGG